MECSSSWICMSSSLYFQIFVTSKCPTQTKQLKMHFFKTFDLYKKYLHTLELETQCQSEHSRILIVEASDPFEHTSSFFFFFSSDSYNMTSAFLAPLFLLYKATWMCTQCFSCRINESYLNILDRCQYWKWMNVSLTLSNLSLCFI